MVNAPDDYRFHLDPDPACRSSKNSGYDGLNNCQVPKAEYFGFPQALKIGFKHLCAITTRSANQSGNW
jgi:hypothetical protein